MELTVKQSELARELGLLISIARRNKSTIPVLNNVLLVGENNRMILTATDLSVGGEITIPCKITQPGATTIPAARLHDYIKLLPESDIRIVASETNWTTITCGRSKSRMAGMSKGSYPELPTRPEPFAQIAARSMATLIGQVFFAISQEESRFSLNGALLLTSDKGIILAATDGHRLAYALQPANIQEPEKVVISLDGLQELQRMAAAAEDDDVIECSSEQNHLFFAIENRVLFGRKLSGSFPDIERVLPRTSKIRVEIPREELMNAILRGKGFADDKSHALLLTFSGSELVLSAATDSTNFEESITIQDGPVLETKFNSLYLLDFLRACSEAKIALLLNDATEAMEMRPVIGDQAPGSTSAALPQTLYRYVVMPMRA